MFPSLARRNPIVVQFSQRPQHFCRRFLFLCGNDSSFSAFCLVVRQPFDAGTNTCPRLYIPFLFCKIDIREDANIHKANSCKYLSNRICTAVDEWHHGYFCLRYFFSSAHFDLVSLMAQKVWRLSASVLVHDRYPHAGNCICLPSNIGLFLATGSKYLFLLQRLLVPFDS